MKAKSTTMIMFFLLLCSFAADAQEEDSATNIMLIPTPRIWGLDLFASFPFSLFPGDIKTVFWVEAGYGYERIGFFREPDGTPYDGSASGFDPESSPYFIRQNIRFNLGLEQGLLWNERLNINLFSFFLFYKLRYDDYIRDEHAAAPQLIFMGDNPDKDGIFQNSLLLGVKWSDVRRNLPHSIWEGLEGEASVELAPGFPANTVFGPADFTRYNFSFRSFLPLFDITPASEANMLSAYCGLFVTIDYMTGNYIPINALQTVGGRRPKPGLGYTVRGIEAGRFDSRLKAAANFDLRINLPELADGILQPGCILYFDAGYYNFMDFDESGIVCTTGGGVYLSIFQVLHICSYAQVLLNESLVKGGSFLPFALELSFHF